MTNNQFWNAAENGMWRTDNADVQYWMPLNETQRIRLAEAIGLWEDVSGFSARHAIDDPALALKSSTGENVLNHEWTRVAIGHFKTDTNNDGIRDVFKNGTNSHAKDSLYHEVFIGDHLAGVQNFQVGSSSFNTLVHELGHSILGHFYSGITGFNRPIEPDGKHLVGADWETIMNDGSPDDRTVGQPSTPMTFDIDYAVALYGSARDTRLGSDHYGFNVDLSGPYRAAFDFSVNKQPLVTIFDNGGHDTLDASGFRDSRHHARAVSIDLNPGASSSMLDGKKEVFAVIYKSMWGDEGSTWIEDAIGGGGKDTIIGNKLDNTLTGNGGNDTLEGRDGKDTLRGGAGEDRLWGGNDGEVDTLEGGADNDTYILGESDIVREGVGGGTDTIITTLTSYSLSPTEEIENLEFNGGLSEATFVGAGNALDNRITGGLGLDELWGLDGNDTLDGGLGDDTLRGGNGDDTYYANDEDEHIIEDTSSLSGTDIVYSSAHDFTLSDNVENLELLNGRHGRNGGVNGTGNTGNNEITGNSRTNILDGADGDDVLRGGLGADTLIGGQGIDTADYSQSLTRGVTVDMLSPTAGDPSEDEGAGDSFQGVENIRGSRFADVISGDDKANLIIGGGGIDVLDGRGGDDTIRVKSDGLGSTVNGGDGIDTLSFADEVLEVTADLSVGRADFFETGWWAHSDGTSGTTKNLAGSVSFSLIENLTGGAAADTLSGDDKANILDGAGGDNVLNGRGGSDTFLVDTLGADIVDGGDEADGTPGSDTLSFAGASEGVTVDLGARRADFYQHAYIRFSGEGYTYESYTTTQVGSLTFTGIENLTGSAFADTLTGDDKANILDGGLGIDTAVFHGRSSEYEFARLADGSVQVRDTVAGRDGTDVLVSIETGRFADGTVDIAAGNWPTSLIVGTAGNDMLYGTARAEQIEGRDGNDSLVGNGGGDTLLGEAGDDNLTVDNTVVRVDGGTGWDVVYADMNTEAAGFMFRLLDTNVEYVVGRNGNDVIDARGTNYALSISGNGGNDTVYSGDGGNTVWAGAGNDTVVGGNGLDQFLGGDGDDVMDGGATNALGDRLYGDAGNDILTVATNSWAFGGTGNDTIRGAGGWLNGDEGNDLIIGGAGRGDFHGGADDDTLIGGSEFDTLDGGDGNDALIGTGGSTVMFGGQGDDTMTGSLTSSNVMYGGIGNDTFTGGDQTDWVYETEGGNETVHAGGGGDIIVDYYGVNFLYGEGGNDWIVSATDQGSLLDGGDGDDRLSAYFGGNILLGGAGNDVLEVTDGGAVANILTGGADADTFVYRLGVGADANSIVTDFQDGVDHIGLRYQSFEQLTITDSAAGAVITYLGYSPMVLAGISASQITHEDFLLVA